MSIAAVMILTTGGFSLYEHFCACNKETRTSFFAEGKHCCADQHISTEAWELGSSEFSYQLSVGGATSCDNSEPVNSSEVQSCCSIENQLKTEHSTLNTEHCSGNCCNDEVKFFRLSEPYTLNNSTISIKSPVKDLEIEYHLILKEIFEDSELVAQTDRHGFFPPPNTIKRLSLLQQFKLSPPSFA